MSEPISNEKVKTILQAARKRFAHYGFSKVTMDEIAGDVELGKASLYYYFPTKEELFKAVVFQEQTELLMKVDDLITSSVSASEKLVGYVERRLRFSRELSNIGTLGVHSAFDAKSFFKKLFEDFEGKELILLGKIIEEGKHSGEFKADIPDDFTKVFLHVLQGLKLRLIRHLKEQRIEEDVQNEIETEMKLVTNILLNGIINK